MGRAPWAGTYICARGKYVHAPMRWCDYTYGCMCVSAHLPICSFAYLPICAFSGGRRRDGVRRRASPARSFQKLRFGHSPSQCASPVRHSTQLFFRASGGPFRHTRKCYFPFFGIFLCALAGRANGGNLRLAFWRACAMISGHGEHRRAQASISEDTRT